MWLTRLAVMVVVAQSAAAWAGDDEAVVSGRKLLAENGCNGACHQKQASGGDALSLYTRANRKVTDLPGLHRQVERCVAGVGASIEPHEIAPVVAALNHDFYKFK